MFCYSCYRIGANELIQNFWILKSIQVFALIFLVIILQFFRNPNRQILANNNVITAPVDGKVVVIEDLISTGGSSLKAVEALKEQGVIVLGMVAIFTYDFPVAAEAFKNAGVKLVTLSNYNALLEIAFTKKILDQKQLEVLSKWRENPSEWNAE